MNMEKRLAIVVIVSICCLVGGSKNAMAQSVKAPPQGKLYQGFYYSANDSNEHTVTPNDVALYEKTVGVRPVWVFFSDNWCEGREFPSGMCEWIHKLGKVPYVRLMLRSKLDQDRAEKLFTLDAIVAGKFDDDLRKWAKGAAQFKAPLLVEWGTECNGRWFSWNGKWNGGKAGPAKFVSAWRHIVQLMRENGATNITWVWHVNDSDVPETAWNRLENYYPGDDCVDWLAVSAYGPLKPNDGEDAERLRDILDKVYPRLISLAPKKPLILAEFGCTRHHPDITAADWARDALNDLFSNRWPAICGFCWWNEAWPNDDNKKHDTDMVIMHDPALSEVFRDQLSASRERIQEKPVVGN